VAAFSLMAAFSASAQLYRCGAGQFTDRPCAGGETVQLRPDLSAQQLAEGRARVARMVEEEGQAYATRQKSRSAASGGGAVIGGASPKRAGSNPTTPGTDARPYTPKPTTLEQPSRPWSTQSGRPRAAQPLPPFGMPASEPRRSKPAI
jgi:hypothetical protein